MELKDKVVIVTGASRGIGRQICLEVGRRGARVVVAARTVDPRHTLPGTIGETVRSIEDAGGTALAVQCDVAKSEDLERLVAAAVDTFGRLDVIVNNAADMTGEDLEGLVTRMIGKSAGPVEDKEVAPAPLERAVDNPLSSWLNQFATNVHAPYLLMSLAVPYMRSQGGGVIVNMSSGAAEMVDLEWLTSLSKHERRLRNDRVGYATTKAALNRMTNAAAAGLATDNIAVVAVDPGTTRTEVAELLGDRGLLDASDFAPMSDAVETVIDILTSDDPMKFSGQVIRAHADEEAP